MVIPYFYGRIVDGINKSVDVRELLYLSCGMLAMFAIKNLYEWWHGVHHIGKIMMDSHERIAETTLKKVMELSIGQINNHNSGFRREVIKKGETALENMMELVIMQVVPNLLRAMIAVIALFFLNVYLGLATVFGVGCFIASSIIINQMMMPELKLQNMIENRLGTYYMEIMRNLRLVMTSTREDETSKDYMRQYHDYNTAGKRIWISYFKRVTWFREPFASIGQFAVLVISIYLINSNQATPGELVMAMGWSMGAFSILAQIGSVHRQIVRHCVTISRYFELLNTPPAVRIAKNPIRPA